MKPEWFSWRLASLYLSTIHNCGVPAMLQLQAFRYYCYYHIMIAAVKWMDHARLIMPGHSQICLHLVGVIAPHPGEPIG